MIEIFLKYPELIMSFCSIFIAVLVLIFSVISFYLQHQQNKKHAIANVRPILQPKSLKYIDKKAIILKNSGIGPAIIKSARFLKNGKCTKNIVELFDFDITWDSYTNNIDQTSLNPREEKILVLLTLDNLLNQGFEENIAKKLLEDWQEQKSGISIFIKYEDIFGNIQDPLETDLN